MLPAEPSDSYPGRCPVLAFVVSKEGYPESAEALEVRTCVLYLRAPMHAVVYRFHRSTVVPDPVSFGKRDGIPFLRVEL